MTIARLKIDVDKDTLHSMFAARVKETPERVAYWQWRRDTEQWENWKWREVDERVAQWKNAFAKLSFAPGTRVAIAICNSVEWVAFDQAALARGLVVVPLFHNDSVANWTHCIKDSQARLVLLTAPRHIASLLPTSESAPSLEKALFTQREENKSRLESLDSRAVYLNSWLTAAAKTAPDVSCAPNKLATIIYTSGTMGLAKGVMLSHRNILSNVCATAAAFRLSGNNKLVSFLPLSHAFERTVGYYLTIYVGAQVAFARSIPELGKDLSHFKPTLLVSVPRIYEQFLARVEAAANNKGKLAKWLLNLCYRSQDQSFPRLVKKLLPLDFMFARKIRERLGGNLKFAISGGAPLFPETEKKLVALGIHVCQGYGLTESAPVIAVNRPGDTLAGSVGKAIPGVQAMIGENHELLVKGDAIMQGYWRNPKASAEALSREGWLRTGDQAKISSDGRIFIIGRIKEIIVMSNGEKVFPAIVERSLQTDPLISQAMVYGEGQAFLVALVVVKQDELSKELERLEIIAAERSPLRHPKLRQEITKRLSKLAQSYSRNASVRGVILEDTPWTVENNLLTPTMKLKRARICERHQAAINEIYSKYWNK